MGRPTDLIFELLLRLPASCLLFAHLARKLDVPFAVPLVPARKTLAFVPGLPEVELKPEPALFRRRCCS